MEKEIWLPVKNYEGLYEISSAGSVKSLPKSWITGRGTLLTKGETIMKLNKSNKGYLRICLTKEKTEKMIGVHRLVAIAFLPNYDDLPEVNHINGVKDDNRLENLEWVTRQENAIHAVKNKLQVPVFGEKHGISVLTEKNVLAMRALDGVLSKKEIAKKFKVSQRTAYLVLNRETWKHI
jgi:hypothetical protein